MATDIEAPRGAERRGAIRARVMLAASLAGEAGTVPVKIRNLSEYGALLEGHPLPARGDAVTLKRGGLAAAARVAWSGGTSCGLEFERPVVAADWLDSRLRPAPAPSAGQARVDAIQQAIRRGAPAPGERKMDRAEAPPGSDLDRRIAEELAHVQRILEVAGEALLGEPIVLHRHAGALQGFDLAAKLVGQLAAILAAEDKAGAVDAVEIAELKARLTRRKL